ncbi:MAG: hypothetical protein B6226_01195 [Candidatus Cloacimonetes bacterium 4572_65]|nr:MAG: hypothetical protein B6226_01195 [Candidatus Cloacimonetes bacterium 4572_65]
MKLNFTVLSFLFMFITIATNIQSAPLTISEELALLETDTIQEHTSGLNTPERVLDISRWAYQLQNLDITQVSENNSFDLIVMDNSSDGSYENSYTSTEIQTIKESGKIAISYISIGEAEDYRSYWQSNWNTNPPAWLGDENPEWAGNYKVRYWHSAWQEIIYSYLDNIIQQGFDGIYMDIIDAYWYWLEETQEEPLAAVYMIQFVESIRAYLDANGGEDMLIIPQNGEYIIWEDSVTDEMKVSYLSVCDAIGIEDIFFTGDLDENNQYAPDTERLQVLQDEYQTSGVVVLSVEYLTQQPLINQYTDVAQQYNFIPYCSVRDLDVLTNGITSITPPLNDSMIELAPNYPNPFNPETTINFSVKEAGHVTISIYNIKGQKIKTLLNKHKSSGNHHVVWYGKDNSNNKCTSGIYLYKMRQGNYTQKKKMVLLK